jgi:hypothetical protein
MSNKNVGKATSSSGVTPAVFKAIASLFMCDDYDDGSAVLTKHEGGTDQLLWNWLNFRAVDLGFDNWIVAYNLIPADGDHAEIERVTK